MRASCALLYATLAMTGPLIGLLGVVAMLRSGTAALLQTATWSARCYAALVVTTWLLRFRDAAHLPLFGTYESALSLAAATMLIAVLWELRRPDERLPLAALAALPAGLLLLHGRRFDPTRYALTISERSWVVDLHALLAWAAFAVLVTNVLLALWLLAGRASRQHERRLLRSLEIGFLLHSAMIISGSVYKLLLFGRAWSFDPIESFAAVVWVVYGTLLHLHRLAGWQGRRLAVWCIVAFVLLVLSYRAIVYFPSWSTYHIFDMDLRTHISGQEGPP